MIETGSVDWYLVGAGIHPSSTLRSRPKPEIHPEGAVTDLGEVLNQDVELVHSVGEGSRSRGFKGPIWSEQESRIRHYHRELDRYVKGEK